MVHEFVRAVAVAGGDELVFVRIFEAEAALGHALLSRALLGECQTAGTNLTSKLPRDLVSNFGRRNDTRGQPANALRAAQRQGADQAER